MKHVFKLSNKYTFEDPGIRGTNFETKELSDKAKFAIIELEREHIKAREKECWLYYYILEGEGNFEIDGKIEECQKEDLVVIPTGSIFKYSGKMKLLLVTLPWWRPEQEEVL